MRLACPSFTTRGSSSNTVGVLRRGSFFGCLLFAFFLLIPLQDTPSAFQTQVLSHLPSALKGTAVHPWMNHRGFSARFSLILGVRAILAVPPTIPRVRLPPPFVVPAYRCLPSQKGN